jgi:hypothetical protein
MREVVVVVKVIDGRREAVAYLNRNKATRDFDTSETAMEMFSAKLDEGE